MTAEQQQPTDTHSGTQQLEIAHQWIEYLKKKNAVATFLWITFLLLGLGLAAFSVVTFLSKLELETRSFSQEQTYLEEKAAVQAALESAELEIKSLTTELIAEREAKQALADQLDTLQSFQGETGEQLALSAKLVAALKQKITALEDERRLLEDALDRGTQERGSVDRKLQQSQALNAQLSEELKSRGAAYTALVKRQKETTAEMERLADLLQQAKSREEQLDKRNASLSQEVSNLSVELQTAKSEMVAMEKKFKALITPIAPAQTSRQLSPVSAAPVEAIKQNQTSATPMIISPVQVTTTNDTKPDTAGDGAKEGANEKPSSLDFESIVIE